MQKRIGKCRRLRGEVSPPGDKSISHRALILNSIATGEAKVSHLSPGEDCQATISCLQALGVQIVEESGLLRVAGVGKEGFGEPCDVLNAANSGTTVRLLAGLLAAQPFLSVVTGDKSLRSRPMARLVHPLRLMGADIWGREHDALAPLAIRGSRLRGIDYTLPVASAQVKSAVLIAGVLAEGRTSVEEPAASRDHTGRMLEAMGVRLERQGLRITLSPPDSIRALDVHVPGDISAAACWLVAASIHPDACVDIVRTGINPSRAGILEVLQEMGAKVTVSNERIEGGEPVADLRAESSALAGVDIGGDLI
ncbi:MAG: 3-phosphoshikimate 1-carboxyvinyltransferase, partial [Chloroflexota bacterium]